MECAAAFSAIAAFSPVVTHTLTGVDSRRVFSFLASLVFDCEAVAAPPSGGAGLELLSAGTRE